MMSRLFKIFIVVIEYNYCEKPNRFKLSTWNNFSLVICTYSDDKELSIMIPMFSRILGILI